MGGVRTHKAVMSSSSVHSSPLQFSHQPPGHPALVEVLRGLLEDGLERGQEGLGGRGGGRAVAVGLQEVTELLVPHSFLQDEDWKIAIVLIGPFDLESLQCSLQVPWYLDIFTFDNRIKS